MDEDQIKIIIAKFIKGGMDRPRAFDKFRTGQWKAIIEWQEHLEALTERFGNPLPAEWSNVVESVTIACNREREAIKLAETIELSGWSP